MAKDNKKRDPYTVTCDEHGVGPKQIICTHLDAAFHTGDIVGFHVIDSRPYPQNDSLCCEIAICTSCHESDVDMDVVQFFPCCRTAFIDLRKAQITKEASKGV